MKFTKIVTTTFCLTLALIPSLKAAEPGEDNSVAPPLLLSQSERPRRETTGLPLTSSTWQPYTSDEGRFAIRLPDKPESQSRSIAIAGETTEWSVFRVQDETGIYAVAYSDLSPTVIEAGKDAVISSIQDTLVSEFNWVALNESGQSISIGGFPGREFIGTQNDALSVLRLYLVDRRLYALVGTSQEIENLSQFLGSFAIETWQDYVSEEGRFSIAFPRMPSEETTDSEELDGKQFTWKVIEARNLNAPDDLYAVAYADVSPADLQAGEDALLNRVGANIVGELQIETLNPQGKAISLDGNPGRAYLAATETGRIVVIHLYVVGQRLYGIGARSETIDNISQFLSSFQVQ